MRRRVYLLLFFVGIFAIPLSPLVADSTTLQEKYLKIFLQLSSGEQLEKNGNYPGALDAFKDCYSKLAEIHEENPEWESALVIQRLADCKAEIISLEAKMPSYVPPAPVQASGPAPTVTPEDVTNLPDDPAILKKRLAEVEAALQSTQDSLRESQADVETYRAQLQTVNAELKAYRSKQSVNDKLGKLLDENKDLTTKLAAAQKELDTFKTNPKSKLAMVQVQLKNLQEQFDASQAANSSMQQTITTLQEHLDQVQADLVSANQKLSATGPDSSDYATVKHENELMRGILQRELQDQARRDEAARLAQEEIDSLSVKSTKLQDAMDTLAEPMTPAANDEERMLLANLKASGADTTSPPPVSDNGNTFSTSTNSPTVTDASTNAAPSSPVAPAAPDAVVPPVAVSTNGAPTASSEAPPPPTSETSMDEAPAIVASNNAVPPASAPTDPSSPPAQTTASAPVDPTATNATSASTGETASTAVDPNAGGPVPPNGPPSIPAPTSPTTTPTPDGTTTPSAVPTDTPTTSQIPAGTTTVTDTTITHGDNTTPAPTDPTQYSTKARLPDDMRDTAQEAADLYKNKRFDEAAAKYQTIIDKYPESLYAWSNLGVVRFQQGDLPDALKALQQAVKLSPTDAFSYANLGIVYYQLNEYENAIDALNAAKALDPNDPKTRNYLGCACSRKGWNEVAEKEFLKAIELDPDFGDAHFNLALVYATEKPPQIELARREYNRALELGIAKEATLEKLLNQ